MSQPTSGANEHPEHESVAARGSATLERPADLATSSPPEASDPDQEAVPEGTGSGSLSRFNSFLAGITLEHVLWAVLILAAILTRFWDLETRTLHHDESLHVFYSWVFATGEQPYVHNPLMHGPFLFHGNALMYLLFGASDATSRILPAMSGVLLVALPWLLRDRAFLGRWGALAASLMLLISPGLLYYTRYIRHDPYTAVGTLILLIAIFRFFQRPQKRWVFLGFVSLAFLLTNHEIVFAVVLAWTILLWGRLLIGRLRPLLPVHLAAGAGGILLLVAHTIFDWRAFPEIPWEDGSAEATRQYYADLLSHPFVIGVLVLAVAFVAGCVYAWRRAFSQRAERDGHLEAAFGDSQPNTVEYGMLHALRGAPTLIAGFVLFLFIFFGLFTTLFTNLNGIATATYATDGTLLYWLGQHDVQRGAQPWFYYITEGVQYEWLAIFFGVAATIVAGIRLVRTAFGRPPTRNLLFMVFVAWWFIFMFLVLSWAGEKMPWLIIHITLPAMLVGACLVQDLVESAGRLRAPVNSATRFLLSHRAWAGVVAGVLVAAAGAWFFLASHLTFPVWTTGADDDPVPTVASSSLDVWWTLVIPPIVALVIIAVAVARLGARRAAYATLSAATVVMILFQMNAGFRMSFLEGDIPRDTMIYNTTSPDVKQLTHDVQDMSNILHGDYSMEITFDSCTQWPLNWYMRDMPNRSLYSAVTEPDELPPVVIGVPASFDGSCNMPEEIDGYTAQTYVFRWHEPESAIYRNFAIAPEIEPWRSAWGSEDQPSDLGAIVRSIGSSLMTLTDPEGQQRAFRLLFFREMPEGTNSYLFNVYVRDDMLPYYNEVRYGE